MRNVASYKDDPGVTGVKDLKIRKAEPSDLDKIVEMQLSLQEHLENSNPSIWRYTREKKELLKQDLEKQFMDDDHLILLAEVKGEIVGFAHAEVQYRTTHIPAIIGSIANIFVYKKFRRQGIGSRLVQEICRFFRRKNVKDIYLRYVLGNKEGEKFWEKLGFKPILVTAHSQIDIVEKRSQTASEKRF